MDKNSPLTTGRAPPKPSAYYGEIRFVKLTFGIGGLRMSRLSRLFGTTYRPATATEIRAWSFGRVTAARRSGVGCWEERRGTIEDPAIFGTEHDDACACGRYVGMRYHRIICDRCGVKVSTRAERSKRFGHIEFPVRVPHPLQGDSEGLVSIPVLPASYVESEAGRRLAPAYDRIVLAANAGSMERIVDELGGLVELLLPAAEFAHLWAIADATALAHGLALESREQDS